MDLDKVDKNQNYLSEAELGSAEKLSEHLDIKFEENRLYDLKNNYV